MIGIVVLCSDTILNTLIFSSGTGGSGRGSYRVKCILGIVATIIGLFGFLTSLTLRMWRVFRVFTIYTDYLDNQKRALGMKSTQDLEIVKCRQDERTQSAMSAHRRNYQESIETMGTAGSDIFQDDTSQMNKIRDLTESKLIKKGMLCFLPICIFGILAIFFPYVYAFLPVDETELCVCSFYRLIYLGKRNFVILDRPE